MRLVLSLPGLSQSTIELVEFYRSDVEILSRLGPTTIVSSPLHFPRDADLVFSWWWDRSLPAAASARGRAHLPIVVTGATDIGNPVGLSAARAAAKNCLARACATLAVKNLAISTAEVERLARWRYPRVGVVPLAVDVDFYAPPSDPHRDHDMLLTILHLNHKSVQRKGLWRAMNGLAQAKETGCRLVVVGADQGARSDVFRRAEHLGIADRITIAGPVSREEKRRLLWRAGAYVQLSFYEGFGYSVAEAMASGCPVITSRGGALVEVTGGLAHAYVGDDGAFADVVRRMPDEIGSLQASAAHCLEHCREELSYDVRQRRLQEVFEGILA